LLLYSYFFFLFKSVPTGYEIKGKLKGNNIVEHKERKKVNEEEREYHWKESEVSVPDVV